MRRFERPLLASRALAALVAAAALVHSAVLLPRVPEFLAVLPPGTHASVWVLATTVVTALLACALALFLTLRGGARAEAVSLALFLGFLALSWGSVLRFASVEATGVGHGSVTVSVSGLSGMAAAVAYALAAASFVRFSVLFPAPLGTADLRLAPPGLRWIRRQLLGPTQTWAAGAVAPFVPFASLQVAEWLGFDPGTLAQGPGRDPFLIGLALLAAWMILVPLAGFGLGVLNLVDGYRVAGPEDRRRLLWILAGSGLAAWMLASPLLVSLVGLLVDTRVAMDVATAAAVMAPLVLVVSLGMAVLYAGSLDPELALAHGTVLGALGLLGIVIFAGIENALSNFVQARLELPGVVGSILAGAVAAGAMLPLHRVAGRARRPPREVASTAPDTQARRPPSDGAPASPSSSTPGSSDPDPETPPPDRSPRA